MAASSSDTSGHIGKAVVVAGAAAVAAAAAAYAAVVVTRSKLAAAERSHKQLGRGKASKQQPPSSGIPIAEVARHTELDSTWIVIHGQVYDVTSWLFDHPGGKMLLLALAGRDATEEFDTVGHSPLANRELRRLHIGRLLDGPAVAAGGMPAPALTRKAVLTGGRKSTASSSDVTELNGSNSDLWDIGSNGFLPCRDPVGVEALRGTAFDVFVDLAVMLPSLSITGELKELLDSSPDMQDRMRCSGDKGALDQMTEDQLERAFSVVGYTMIIYWRGGTLEYSKGMRLSANGVSNSGSPMPTSTPPPQLPGYLARPMLALSKRLGRPPMVDYASSVLYNWARIDPTGPIATTNIRCVMRMTGLLDEEWFFKTHVIIESEASHAVSAVLAASQTDDSTELLQCLVQLEEALWRVVSACLPIMYERTDGGEPKCSENIFYQILRPLIKSGKLTFESDEGPVEMSLTGPSGAMSSLLPCIDAALGIQTTSAKLREALLSFELSMPQKHQRFLADLRAKDSIRQRIVLLRGVGEEYSEQQDALVRAYNRCIARVLDFRWQHWSYVKHFIMKPGNLYHAVGSGGTTFDYLQQHITDTEQARLTPRGSDAFQRALSPGDYSPEMPIRLAPVANHQPPEFWSVDGARGLLSRDPLTSPDGEWASGLPPAVRTAMQVLWNTARRMPALVAADGPFREHVEELSDRLAVLQDERMILRLPETAREHLMTTLSHIFGGCLGVGDRRKKPPRCIEWPLNIVARSVGRPARLDFANLVLANWHVEEQSDGKEEEQEAEHLGVVLRFLSVPDEECYRTLHILLHREARELVSAIRAGQAAMREQNDGDLVNATGRLSVWLNRICDFYDAYFEQKDSRTEAVMIRRLEPFVSRSSVHDLSWGEIACWAYLSGSSAILPALQLFLGINVLGSVGASVMGSAEEEQDSLPTWMSHMVQEMRMCMPQPHRAFLEELEKGGVSVRRYCVRRFGVRSVSVEQLHDLEAAYNDSLNAVLRYLSRRHHLVLRFFPDFASSFAGFHARIEGYMRKSRLQLLKMRQRVHKILEK